MRNKFVSQMQQWIGRKEADGTHKAIIDIYNAHKPLPQGYKVPYTDKWCAATVSACAIATGMTDIVPLECSCKRMIDKAQAMGIWVENDAFTPKPGDIILYDWQDNGIGDNVGQPDHIGVVEKCDGKTITVIEGNINDAVGRRTLSVNGRYIRGYICPRFTEETANVPKNDSKTNTESEETKMQEKRFYFLKNVPADYKPTMEYLISIGKFHGKGGSGENLIVDLGEDSLRVFTVHHRMGIYD